MRTILPAKSYTLKLQYCMKSIFLQNKAIRSIHFDVKGFWISQFIIAASNTGPWRTTNYYHTMCDGQHWSFHSFGWYYTSTTGLFASTAKLHYYYDYIMPHYTHAHAHAHTHYSEIWCHPQDWKCIMLGPPHQGRTEQWQQFAHKENFLKFKHVFLDMWANSTQTWRLQYFASRLKVK